LPSQTVSASRRWLSSERIALRVLEEMGYRVVETRKKVILNGVEVGEIDAIVADESNTLWGVEIKAGRIDVTGIRQAYVNALVAGVKPMVVCKGFADDAAKELAERLGVKVIELSDVFLVDSEELEIVIREVVEDVLTSFLEAFFGTPTNIKQEWLETLNAIASTLGVEEACEKLGVDFNTLTKRLGEMRSAGIIPSWARKYSTIRRIAQLIVQRHMLHQAISEAQKVLEQLKQLREQLYQIQSLITGIRKSLEQIKEGIRGGSEAEKSV
jgi:predicted RecB family endonuclease